ncbi:PQQ-binding-like beta-propeller repeat protein [Streptomyces cavernae]|uniref:outer membrane protein assembly factor BamB family protein n=1 Tax=Streptomyces cavernae TaxID=2259034 RepID=UPI000FEBE0D2|nr:PQQ-binding-like beta-propeller repeat protein [Streptomyces cavernae]
MVGGLGLVRRPAAIGRARRHRRPLRRRRGRPTAAATPAARRLTRRRLLTGGAALAAAGAAGTAWWLAASAPEEAATTASRTAPAPAPQDPDGPPRALWEYRADFYTDWELDRRALLVDDTLLVPAGGRELYGIDARRGTLRWTAQGVIPHLTACGPLAVTSTVDSGGRLAAVEAFDGRVRYTDPLGLSFALLLQPVCASDGRTVYLVGHEPAADYRDDPVRRERFLVAYDMRDRRERWRRPLRRSGASAVVGAVADGMLLFL